MKHFLLVKVRRNKNGNQQLKQQRKRRRDDENIEQGQNKSGDEGDLRFDSQSAPYSQVQEQQRRRGVDWFLPSFFLLLAGDLNANFTLLINFVFLCAINLSAEARL